MAKIWFFFFFFFFIASSQKKKKKKKKKKRKENSSFSYLNMLPPKASSELAPQPSIVLVIVRSGPPLKLSSVPWVSNDVFDDFPDFSSSFLPHSEIELK